MKTEDDLKSDEKKLALETIQRGSEKLERIAKEHEMRFLAYLLSMVKLVASEERTIQ